MFSDSHCLNSQKKCRNKQKYCKVKAKSLEGRECPTVDIETYNKRRKEIVAKQ